MEPDGEHGEAQEEEDDSESESGSGGGVRPSHGHPPYVRVRAGFWQSLEDLWIDGQGQLGRRARLIELPSYQHLFSFALLCS